MSTQQATNPFRNTFRPNHHQNNRYQSQPPPPPRPQQAGDGVQISLDKLKTFLGQLPSLDYMPLCAGSSFLQGSQEDGPPVEPRVNAPIIQDQEQDKNQEPPEITRHAPLPTGRPPPLRADRIHVMHLLDALAIMIYPMATLFAKSKELIDACREEVRQNMMLYSRLHMAMPKKQRDDLIPYLENRLYVIKDIDRKLAIEDHIINWFATYILKRPLVLEDRNQNTRVTVGPDTESPAFKLYRSIPEHRRYIQYHMELVQ